MVKREYLIPSPLLRKYEAVNAFRPSPQPSPVPEVARARGRLLSIALDERTSWALQKEEEAVERPFGSRFTVHVFEEDVDVVRC
jgi:hypothetical protein